MTRPEKLLHNDRMYLAADRIVCGRVACAGNTAAYTGWTTGGARVTVVRIDDVASWVASGLGAMRCECGAMKATIADGRMTVAAA